MNPDWVRTTPRVFGLSISFPDRYMPVHVTAVIHKDKRWRMFINNEYIADFHTFEELDGMVPVLVNAHIWRTK